MHQRQLGALVRTTLFSPVGRALVRAAHADSKQSAPGMWAQCSFENFRANKLAEMSHGRGKSLAAMHAHNAACTTQTPATRGSSTSCSVPYR
jgi:hypothetical protein